MGYRIGLDVGITSVGWATIETVDCKDCRIGSLGVRIFDKPENPQDGSSLALPRREKRSLRRRVRRRRLRMETIKELFEKYGLVSVDDLTEFFHSNDNISDVYELRVKALDCKLADIDFARVLLSIAKHRGFKSTRKSKTRGRFIRLTSFQRYE